MFGWLILILIGATLGVWLYYKPVVTLLALIVVALLAILLVALGVPLLSLFIA